MKASTYLSRGPRLWGWAGVGGAPWSQASEASANVGGTQTDVSEKALRSDVVTAEMRPRVSGNETDPTLPQPPATERLQCHGAANWSLSSEHSNSNQKGCELQQRRVCLIRGRDQPLRREEGLT